MASDDYYKIGPARLHHFNEKLRAVLGTPDPRCSLCGTNAWSLSDSIFELHRFDPSEVYGGGKRVPVFVMNCQKCGHAVLLNAVSLGFIDPSSGQWTAAFREKE